jgi:hypothetical protein
MSAARGGNCFPSPIERAVYDISFIIFVIDSIEKKHPHTQPVWWIESIEWYLESSVALLESVHRQIATDFTEVHPEQLDFSTFQIVDSLESNKWHVTWADLIEFYFGPRLVCLESVLSESWLVLVKFAPGKELVVFFDWWVIRIEWVPWGIDTTHRTLFWFILVLFSKFIEEFLQKILES